MNIYAGIVGQFSWELTANTVVAVIDGLKALEYLRYEGKYASRHPAYYRFTPCIAVGIDIAFEERYLAESGRYNSTPESHPVFTPVSFSARYLPPGT
jgi:hypothetical protein